MKIDKDKLVVWLDPALRTRREYIKMPLAYAEWSVVEAEEVLDAMARDVDVLRPSTWPAFNSGPAAMRAPTYAFASAWERSDR